MAEEQTPEEAVKEWLSKQGYPLEMRVAAALRNAGFAVMQSAYFLDPSSAKPRELDVVAHRYWSGENVAWQLTLLIECKVTKKQPWVLFTRALETTDTEGMFHYYRIPASKLGRQLLTRMRRLTDARGKLPAFEFDDRPGYGLQRATLGAKADTQTDNPRNVAFEAAMTISSAAVLSAGAVDSE